jgi:galactose-6-phosphate isomerase
MPDLDVSDLLTDPDFAEELTIIRRAVTINTHGRQQVAETTISPKPWGVVLPQSDQPLQRGPDQQSLPMLLQVHTKFRLRSASIVGTQEYQPDLLIWNGSRFLVNRVYPFSHFGQGFIVADCSSMTTTEAPPP